MKQIRIVIADDHAVVRTGLAALLELERDMKPVGEAADGMSAVDVAHPDSSAASNPGISVLNTIFDTSSRRHYKPSDLRNQPCSGEKRNFRITPPGRSRRRGVCRRPPAPGAWNGSAR